MTDLQLELARNQLVVKSNNLIQKARYTFTAQQQKIILYLISKIKPTDEEFKLYCFDLHDLCELCGITYNSKNYRNFEDSIRELKRNPFWINCGDKRQLIDWVTDVEIDLRRHTVQLRIDPRLKPYLLQLREQFTAYELGLVLQMKSRYSIRIYELLKSYSNLGIVHFKLTELKEILQITDEYSDYRNFKKFIIERALKEINLYTDLNCNFYSKKTGNRVTDLFFQLSRKDDVELEKLRLLREKAMKEGTKNV